MHCRQTEPTRWLIVTAEDARLWDRLGELKRGDGVVLLFKPKPLTRRRLRLVARRRRLVVCEQQRRSIARVHDAGELRQALMQRTRLIMLSPLWPTASHPEWAPLPRMRAAALARLGRRRLVALGGMTAKRYAKIARLGFKGWAGISAFRT